MDVIIFEGNEANSPVEEMLLAARHAALRDNLDKLMMVPEVKRIILATNREEFKSFAALPKLIVEVNSIPPTEFHFGTQLKAIIERYQIQTVLCMGGAAVPLIEVEQLRVLAEQIMVKEGRYITNNVQSADIIAFNPAGALQSFALPATDNALALLLRYDVKFEQVLLPVTLGTQFDIDTPTDLLILAASPFGGQHLRSTLGKLALDTENLERTKEVLRGAYNDVAVIGRIGAPAIERLNKHLKVRLRVFSEERGMKALGRLERNEVVSLLGFWLDEIGSDRFFTYLARTVQAAFIDTRVLFAHRKLSPTDADRFYSDLGMYEKVKDPFIRDFTRAAKECAIPVILGGHSLVTGGVLALIEELCRQ